MSSQEVVRQWYTKEAHVVDTIAELIVNAEECAHAFATCTDATIEGWSPLDLQ